MFAMKSDCMKKGRQYGKLNCHVPLYFEDAIIIPKDVNVTFPIVLFSSFTSLPSLTQSLSLSLTHTHTHIYTYICVYVLEREWGLLDFYYKALKKATKESEVVTRD